MWPLAVTRPELQVLWPGARSFVPKPDLPWPFGPRSKYIIPVINGICDPNGASARLAHFPRGGRSSLQYLQHQPFADDCHFRDLVLLGQGESPKLPPQSNRDRWGSLCLPRDGQGIADRLREGRADIYLALRSLEYVARADGGRGRL